jgi:hypothetical protein
VRERRLRGFERGAPNNGRPYRDTASGNIADDIIMSYLDRHIRKDSFSPSV